MAYGNHVKTDALSTTYTVAAYTVGSLRMESADEVTAGDASLSGDRTWVFIKAAVAIALGDVVEKNVASVSFEGKPCVTAAAELVTLIGVAQHAIALNSYGWVVKAGEAVVSTTGVTAGETIATDASADGIPTVANASAITDTTAQAFGRAITSTAGGLSDAYISIP